MARAVAEPVFELALVNTTISITLLADAVFEAVAELARVPVPREVDQRAAAVEHGAAPVARVRAAPPERRRARAVAMAAPPVAVVREPVSRKPRGFPFFFFNFGGPYLGQIGSDSAPSWTVDHLCTSSRDLDTKVARIDSYKVMLKRS